MRQTIKRLSRGVLTRLTLGVVTLGPVVPGTRLTEHKVVRPEDGTKSARSGETQLELETQQSASKKSIKCLVWTQRLKCPDVSPHAVHGAGLKVNQDCPGHVLGAAGLVVVHIDPLQLEVGGAHVRAGGVDAMLV